MRSFSPNPESRIPNPDLAFLLHAERIAARGMGRTWPNPSVGCVLVKHGRVLAAERTADGGRPHAETQALAAAGAHARGATAYVTLEPCAHHGKTPPCAEALIAAGVARVVIGATDPDPRVNGRGIALLREAGIEVSQEGASPSSLYKGFFRRIHHNLPEVWMKLASSSDGWMADSTTRWITGDAARAHGHLLRSQCDAILTGIGTVLADDPMLSVRLPGITHPNFPRIVVDSQLRTPLACQLVRSAESLPTWIVTTTLGVEQQASHAVELREHGVKLLVLESQDYSPVALLHALAGEGITRLLIEAGPTLCQAFLAAQAVDRLYHYQAPSLLGNAGHARLPTLEGGNITQTLALGEDRCDVREFVSCLPD